MSRRNKPDVRDLCAHTAGDDFKNPKFDKRGEVRRTSGKDLALCKQAARAIDQSLAAIAWSIDVGLRVVAVEPAPDATRLRVLVAWSDRAIGLDVVLGWLHARKGRLRSEVAMAITRKRAPDLIFAPAVDRQDEQDRQDDRDEGVSDA